jgi:hypothetical protein
VHDGHLLNARALLQLREHRGVFSKMAFGQMHEPELFLFSFCKSRDLWKGEGN